MNKIGIIVLILTITSICAIYLLNIEGELPSKLLQKKFMKGSDSRLICDEIFHYKQIVVFSQLEFKVIKGLTTTPGYNFVIGLLGRALRANSVEAFRIISTIFSLLSVIVFFIVVKDLGSSDDIFKTLQFFFFPLVFPFFYLFYTDISAVLFLLVSFFFYSRKHYALVGFFLIIGLAFRQTLIFWFFFYFVLLAVEEYAGAFDWSYIRKVMGKSWSLVLGIVLFALFVFLNKGVALGNQGEHPLETIHFGNIYLCLFLSFFLFLPLHAENVKKIYTLIINRYLTVLLSVGLFGVLFFVTFKVDHHFNQASFSYFLTNNLLDFFTRTLWGKIFFLSMIVFVLLSLFVTELRKNSYAVLYLTAVVALLPHWLIQPRYYIPIYTMFLLFQKDKSTRFNVVFLLYLVVLAAILFWYISNHTCFI